MKSKPHTGTNGTPCPPGYISVLFWNFFSNGSTRLGSMIPHTPHCFFAAPRKPQHVSRAHVTHAVTTRITLCPRLVDGGTA